MTKRTQIQANPTLDKPGERLGLAGAGILGPILKGLGGHLKIEIDRDEILESVRIFSRHSNQFDREYVDDGTFTNLDNGRRQWDFDIVFGQHTDFGLTGALPVRNFLEWTIRKRGVVNPEPL
jgi:hypothetical protein